MLNLLRQEDKRGTRSDKDDKDLGKVLSVDFLHCLLSFVARPQNRERERGRRKFLRGLTKEGAEVKKDVDQSSDDEATSSRKGKC